MPTETKLADLLLRWEELRREGQALAAEELCRDCPELLDELKRRINALAELDPLLQTASSSDPETLRAQLPLVGTLRPPTFAPPISSELELAAAGELGLPKVNRSGFATGSEPVPGYQLVERLGRGGFGEVWKAIAPGGFSVALKLVPLHEKVGATELQALEIVKSLRHPNLLTAFGAWQREGLLIIAMELADRTLWDRYQEARQHGSQGIPPEEVLEYLREAAKGIDYLNEPRHRLAGKERVSIQHRDIKPHNILLVGSGVKVADFGLVRLLEHALTGHSGSMTPSYAAPEFLRGQTASQSDQYCLGVTYCEVRGGRLPFEGTHAQVLSGHLMEPPDLTMLPEQERPVVARALAKEPSERWPSCRAFVEALAASMRSGKHAEISAPALSPKAKQRSRGEPRSAARPRRRLAQWIVLPVMAAAVAAAAVYLPPFLRTKTKFAQHRTDSTSHVAQTQPTLSGALEESGPRTADESAEQRSGEIQANELPGPETQLTAPRQPEDVTPQGEPKDNPAEQKAAPDFNEQPVAQTKPLAEQSAAQGLLEPAQSAEAVLATTTAKPAEQPKASDEIIQRPEQSPVAELRRFARHVGGVKTVAVSPEGRYILSAGDDRLLRLWDIDTGEEIYRFAGHSEAVNCVAFSHDGRQAISGGEDKAVRLWDVAARAALPALLSHTEPVFAVAFTSDNRQAISAGQDSTIRVWDLEQHTELARFGLSEESIWNLALSPDNRRAVTASDSSFVRLWDVAMGAELHRFEGHREVVWCVAMSPDGSRALSGGGLNEGTGDYAVRLWDVERRTLLRQFHGHTGAIGSVAFSPDGRRAVSGSVDKTVRLWDVDSGDELRCFKGHTDAVFCVTLSPDGRRALSASRDGTVRVWGLPE